MGVGERLQVGAFPHYGGRWAEWNGHFRDSVRQFIKVRLSSSMHRLPALNCQHGAQHACTGRCSRMSCPGSMDCHAVCLASHERSHCNPDVTRAYCARMQGTEGQFAGAFATALTGSPHIYNSPASDGDWCAFLLCAYSLGTHHTADPVPADYVGLHAKPAFVCSLRLSALRGQGLGLRAHRWGTGSGAQWRSGRGPVHSINFITAHDGFPLADLVAFNKKHNAANGENNKYDKP